MEDGIKIVNIDDIFPYANNPRKNKLAIDKVAKSIELYGFQQPIVIDKNNIIVVGHTRYNAAKKLGMTEVPILYARKDGVDLSEEKCKEYRIIDNKSAEYSEWDMNILNQEIIDIDDFVLSEFDIDKLEIEDDIDYKQEHISPYKMIHFLISTHPDNYLKIKEHIEAIEDIEGVEVEKGSN